MTRRILLCPGQRTAVLPLYAVDLISDRPCKARGELCVNQNPLKGESSMVSAVAQFAVPQVWGGIDAAVSYLLVHLEHHWHVDH